MLKNYYLQRLLSPDFWRKLFSGRFSPTRSLSSLLSLLRKTGETPKISADIVVLPSDAPLTQRVPHSMLCAQRPMLVLLSGKDFVAAEFVAEMGKSPLWSKVLASSHAEIRHFPDANHTFSSQVWRALVEQASIEWTATLANRL